MREEKRSKARSPLTRILLIAAGSLSVGMGVLGIFLPLLPTTPFLLLAAACYVRSSDRLYTWLITNRWLGEYIRNCQEGRGIPLRAKVLGVLLLWATILSSAFFAVETFLTRVVLLAVAVGVSAIILSFPTLRR